MVWNAYSQSGWNPWSEFARLQSELDRVFQGVERATTNEFPPIDVWSGEDGLRIFAQLPGFEPADIDVSVVGDTLTIKGARREDGEQEGAWHRREREAGRFVRTLQLPYGVEVDAVRASFASGVLDVALPRAASEKPRRIAVSAQ
jgi:HSP20 family protein